MKTIKERYKELGRVGETGFFYPSFRIEKKLDFIIDELQRLENEIKNIKSAIKKVVK